LKFLRKVARGGGAASKRALLLLAALAAGCGGGEPAPAPDRTPPDLVLVVSDTLRADYLHGSGPGRPATPAFDSLARDSVRFLAAWSTSSWTLPATASIFLSQLPSQHGVARWGSVLGAEPAALVDLLRGAGYRTGMWTANHIVAGGRGFAQRFDHYELVTHPGFRGGAPVDATAFGEGGELAARALAWMREVATAPGRPPFFAYLHFMEPHGPYLCPADAPPDCAERARALNQRLLEFRWSLDPGEKQFLAGLYAADVESMDAALAQLLAGLDGAGLSANAWVIVVADHGELLGEWDMYMHGRTLFEPLLHVPLLARGPGARPGPVETPVSLVDLAPTLLELAGLAAPPSFRGRSLAPALRGERLEDRPVVAELLQTYREQDARQRHVLAVRDGSRKLLVRTDGVVERYDLAADPDERRPLATRQGELGALLERAGLGSGFDVDAYLGVGSDAPEPSHEMREALRQLGYLDARGAAPPQ
jgi:arylsulfatase A-like enzyme